MSAPIPLDQEATSEVLWEIHDERAKQDTKWGEQNHPNVDPLVAEHVAANVGQPRRELTIARFYRVPTATVARELCQQAAADGRSTWGDILLEEFCEFLEAAGLGDDVAARGELVQLAAVAVAAVQAHDRRQAQKAARDGAC
jgi:hypothetical protein